MAMQKQRLDFTSWEPDVAKLDGTTVPEAQNVLPSKRGYKPMPSLARSLGIPALPARPIEVVSFCGTDGTRLTYAGTTSTIRALEAGSDGSLSWVTKLSTAEGDVCKIFRYGTTVYALMRRKLYSATADSGVTGNFTAVTNTASSGSIPNAECAAVVQDFVVLGALEEYPTGIRWSAMDDPTCWPPVGSDEAINKQSDIQIFPEGGKVLRIVGGMSASVTGIVFLEHAIQRMQYVGSPYIFQFSPIERSRGLLSPDSAVVCGSQCFFLAEDGFRTTDGDSTKTIGSHRVDEWFFSQCDSTRLKNVRGIHDIERRLVWWFFSSKNCAANVTDMAIVYDYTLDRWSYGKLSCEFVFSDYGRSVTLEDLNSYETEYPGGIDKLPFRSLDGIPQGGNPILAAVDTQHRMCLFDGTSLPAEITTQEIGGDRFMLHGLRPLVDCGKCTVKPLYRSRQQDPQRGKPETSPQRDGVCYQHLSTVYLSAKVKISADESWNHAVGVEALVEPEGGM